ncbi:MAG: hypothetical protein KJ607_08925 [Bacteroidetes bacterium]|nr:hypothetical protein [Bacteroidota bacterium]
MRKTATGIGAILMAFVIILSIAQTGCKKKKDAPEIPPLSTFQMTFDLDTNNNKDIQTKVNYFHAGGNVLFWSVVIGLNMIVPVAAFAESFKHEAIWDNHDETWTWEYTVNTTYSAKLVAGMDGDYVHWEMYISKNNVYTDVLWYEGDSKTDGSEGTWSLNYNESNPQPFVDIVWHRTVGSDIYDIKYTNVISGNAGNGGYIEYGITGGSPYDAFYNIYIIEQNRHVDIEWNRSDKTGHVKDQDKFGDTDWHCWDANLDDVTCP